MVDHSLLVTVRERADNTCMRDTSGHTYSYKGVHTSACMIALWLQRHHGLKPGNVVAMKVSNPILNMTCLLGSLYAAVGVVPIAAGLEQRDEKRLLKNAGAKLVLTDDSLDDIATHGFEIGSWQPLTDLDGSKPWLTIFTSGTTGKPKKIVHSWNSLLCAAQIFNHAAGIYSDHCFYHTFPMHYVAGILNSFLCPFIAGASIAVGKQPYVLSFWRDVSEANVNVLWLTPSLMSAVLQADRGTLGERYARESIEEVFVGTAPLHPRVRSEFEQRYGVRVHESYGLSETLFVTLGADDDPPGSVGRALRSSEIRLAEDGEIEVSSATAMLNREWDWFATGDLGLIRSNHLYVTGRKKDLIIRGGVNVSPRRIEDVLMLNDKINAAGVVGCPDKLYGEKIIACIVMRRGFTLGETEPELKELCTKMLQVHEQPNGFLVLDRLPRNTTGKVDKQPLRALVAPRRRSK